MATTKVVSVLDNNVTCTAGAADADSSVWTLDDGYGGSLYIKVTNGSTGPTVTTYAFIQCSPDNSNWYSFGGKLYATLGNSIVTSWTISIPEGIEYLKVTHGGNTVQNTTIRVEGSEITAIS
jgi:hypothetical protein